MESFYGSRSAKLFFVIACLVFVASAETGNALEGLEYGGWVRLGGQRIVKSSAIPNIESPEPYLNGVWFQTVSGGLWLSSKIGDRLTISSGLGGNISGGTQSPNAARWILVTRTAGAYINRAGITLLLGDIANPPIEANLGFFGYNYTKVRDFGGYLYTAGLRPMYLTSSGGGAGLAGVLLRIKHGKNFRHDVIFNLETDHKPFLDPSFGYVGTLNLDDKFEVGAGVKLHRFASSANEDEDPHLVYTTYNYYESDGSIAIEKMPFGGVKAMLRARVNFGKLLDVNKEFWGREPFCVYGEAAVLGFEDYPLNIQGRGYNDITERIPVMGGVTLPTHPIFANGLFPVALSAFLIGIKEDSTYESNEIVGITSSMQYNAEANENVTVYDTTYKMKTKEFGFKERPERLAIWAGASVISGAVTFLLEKLTERRFRFDDLAVEVEWCRSPYNNNHGAANALPEFVTAFDQATGMPLNNDPWHKDDWRWAVMFNKKVLDRVSIGGKIACDHMRFRNEDGSYSNAEKLYSIDEWYWDMGIGLSF